MSDVNEQFVNTLKQAGFSLTSVRKRVFFALHKAEPISMGQLVASLPKVDKASVYRTVALFEKLGIVQRLQMGWKYKLELTDVYSYHHHHLSCRNCGMIVSLRENSMLEASLNALAGEYGFVELTHQLEIQGLCPKCQNR